ncbi:MAG TPA: ankyrin repeat domain-containing protein [Bryocella sp.]|nr:ankyrin repeat domain-containing protein [Bryocella sp.]
MKRIAAALLLLTTTGIAGQSSRPLKPPVDVDLYRGHVKQISPEEVIRAEDDPAPASSNLTPIQRAMHLRNRIFDNMVQVQLDVIVNENGRVESAKPIDGPQQFYQRAQAIETRKEFEPIRVDGSIVRAHLTDSVQVLPPERWNPTPQPFPANPILSTISMSLERTGCLGSCPTYRVSISGLGDVVFSQVDGYQGYVAVPGTHHWIIKQQAVMDLLDEFRKAHFLSALNSYQCNWTDLPSQTITLAINGRTQSVVDYGGAVVGLPSSIQALEQRIDDVAGTARWVNGNDETLSALRAEQWNFAANTPENIALFNASIQRNNSDLVHLFVIAKAPIVSPDPQNAPVCTATATGNIELVEQLLSGQPSHYKIPPEIADECLSVAARSGSLPLVELWLNRGGHPTPVPPIKPPSDNAGYDPGSPLLNAIQGANPDVVSALLAAHADISSERNNGRSLVSFALSQMANYDENKPRHDAGVRVVRLLLQAHANINEETDSDRAALYDVSETPELIPDLLQAGANINMRNEAGETPLMYASTEEAVKALLAAGADPSIRSKDGKSAAEEVRRWSCKSCAVLIENAIAQRNALSGPQ